MSKASEYVEAAKKRPSFHVRGSASEARISDDGDLILPHKAILAKDIPAFIAWLRDTFEEGNVSN